MTKTMLKIDEHIRKLQKQILNKFNKMVKEITEMIRNITKK